MAMQKLLDFGFNHIDIWRSEPMSLAQLMIPAESAHQTVLALGDIGLLQFKDLNGDKSAAQRIYASQVKRCDEMARRLRFFKDQVAKASVDISPSDLPSNTLQLEELELKLEELELELIELNGNNEKLMRSYSELNEMHIVLDKAGTAFFDGAKAKLGSSSEVAMESYERGFGESPAAPLLEAGVEKTTKAVGFIAGTLLQEKVSPFERLLFRATRGNLYLKTSLIDDPICDPSTGEMQKKCVFGVFFSGDRAKAKISKICDAFNANRYPFPEEVPKQRQMFAEVTSRLRELHSTNESGQRRKESLLSTIALGLHSWTTMVRREKAVYHTMNKMSMDVTSKVLIAEVWVPEASAANVSSILSQSAQSSNTGLQPIMVSLPSHEEPPTYYETNKFTACFQTIVEAYGVARYREVNPAVLTIMTFPFLFAVMFGDWGNAILMVLFAAPLLYYEKSLMKMNLGDMGDMIFAGRYCIMLMAIYSIYTGFIYNEWFSMPSYIFGRSRFVCYNMTSRTTLTYPAMPPPEWPSNITYSMPVGGTMDPRDCQKFGGSFYFPAGTPPYVFGVDPIWHGRKTELPYVNSLKMKMSILIGVVHMNSGILMSLFNNLNSHDMLSMWCEFVPQMIFLNAIFGYLCLLIVVKWITGSTADLYNVLINMFLGVGKVTAGNQLFPGQQGLQQFLLACAFLSVPWMLLPKPLVLKKRHEAAEKKKGHLLSGHSSSSSTGVEMTATGHSEGHPQPLASNGSTGDLAASASSPPAHGGGGGGHGHGDHFDFSEILVHQMIHTIEFVLGAVSNTASYLRLWALSLAHAQLSSVFYDRVLMPGIQTGFIGGFIGFYVFALTVLGVLMVMESLSAFLHALRLHWVEFMNKFYKGDGYKFAPFDLKEIELIDDDPTVARKE